jgi:dihydroorotase
MIGLEPAIPVLLGLVREGALSALRLIESLSTSAARVAGLAAGTLREGAPADIAVIDPELDWTLDASSLSSRSVNTPLLGQRVRGRNSLTIVDGQVVYER